MDCDPGHDDAIALVLAAACPELDIRCVTTTAGNQTLEKTTYNARRILTLIGRSDIPVAKGRETPLLAKPMQAASVHAIPGWTARRSPSRDRRFRRCRRLTSWRRRFARARSRSRLWRPAR